MERKDSTLNRINSDDTIDIPDFVEDKTSDDNSVDLSIFKMSDDELYDNKEEIDDDFEEEKPKRKKKNNGTTLIICLVLIVLLLATTIGSLIYAIKQRNAYVKVNTENVQLKANEDNYKKQLAEKDATIAALNEQINSKNTNPSSDTPSGQGTLVYEVVDGGMHFRKAPTSDAEAITYNGKELASNGEKYNVIEIVNDRDLGDKLKWAKIADEVYFCVEDNGAVWAKKVS